MRKGSNKALDDSRDFYEKTEPLGQITIAVGKVSGQSRAVMQVDGIIYIEGLQVHFQSETLKPDVKASLADGFLLHLMQEIPRMLMQDKARAVQFSYGFTLCDAEGNRLPDDDPLVKEFIRGTCGKFHKSASSRSSEAEKNLQ